LPLECDRCGSIVPEGSAFCPKCGEPIRINEKVLGIMIGEELLGKRFRPDPRRSIFFTTNRLIVAERGTLKEFASFFAGGFLGYWLAIRSDKKKAEKLKQLSPEAILKADEENYELPYTTASDVEVKKYSRLMWPYSTEIRFKTQEKEHKFRLKSIKFRDVVDLLHSVLHEKVSVT